MKLEQPTPKHPALIIPNDLLDQKFHSWPEFYPHWWEEDFELGRPEEQFAQFSPEVRNWCLETFSQVRMPILRWSDNSDYDRSSYWAAWFKNESDMIMFKLRWSDGPN